MAQAASDKNFSGDLGGNRMVDLLNPNPPGVGLRPTTKAGPESGHPMLRRNPEVTVKPGAMRENDPSPHASAVRITDQVFEVG